MRATEQNIRLRFMQALKLYDLLEPNEDEFATYRLNREALAKRFPGFLPNYDFQCVPKAEELFEFIETNDEHLSGWFSAAWLEGSQHTGMELTALGINDLDFNPGLTYDLYPPLYDKVDFSPFDSLCVTRQFNVYRVMDRETGEVYIEDSPLAWYRGSLDFTFIGPQTLFETRYDQNNGYGHCIYRLIDGKMVESQIEHLDELKAIDMAFDGPPSDEFDLEGEYLKLTSNEPELIHDLLERFPLCLEHLGDEIKDNPNFIRWAAVHDLGALQFASTRLRSDKAFLIDFVMNYPGNITELASNLFKFLDPSLKNNAQIALAIMDRNPESYDSLCIGLRHNSEIKEWFRKGLMREYGIPECKLRWLDVHEQPELLQTRIINQLIEHALQEGLEDAHEHIDYFIRRGGRLYYFSDQPIGVLDMELPELFTDVVSSSFLFGGQLVLEHSRSQVYSLYGFKGNLLIPNKCHDADLLLNGDVVVRTFADPGFQYWSWRQTVELLHEPLTFTHLHTFGDTDVLPEWLYVEDRDVLKLKPNGVMEPERNVELLPTIFDDPNKAILNVLEDPKLFSLLAPETQSNKRLQRSFLVSQDTISPWLRSFPTLKLSTTFTSDEVLKYLEQGVLELDVLEPGRHIHPVDKDPHALHFLIAGLRNRSQNCLSIQTVKVLMANASREQWAELLAVNGELFMHAPLAIRSDLELARTAALQAGCAYQVFYASDEIKNNLEFALDVVNAHAKAITYFEHLASQSEFLANALQAYRSDRDAIDDNNELPF
jgi:hypothetical protein